MNSVTVTTPSKKYYVHTGAELLTVAGELTAPLRGAGKVEVGQCVNIKFDNYPYMEYGMVKDTIRTMALVPVKTQRGMCMCWRSRSRSGW